MQDPMYKSMKDIKPPKNVSAKKMSPDEKVVRSGSKAKNRRS